MSKKKLLYGRDKELYEFAEQYEAAKAENRTIYLDADDLADLADWYAMRHKYDMATEVIKYALYLHPDNTTLLVEQAYLLLDVGDKEKAEEVVDSIIEDRTDVKVLRANFLLLEDREEEADALLENIEDKDVLFNIIDISYMYIDMGMPEKAMSWLKRGGEEYAEEEAYIAAMGDCYHTLNMPDKAIAYFNKLIDRNPYSAFYWFELSRCYLDLQMFDKAIEACDYVTVIDDEFADAYTLKGHAFFQLGNEESALENYRMAEKLNGLTSCYINSFIGFNKVSKGEWKEAYEYLEKAIAGKDGESSSIIPAIYTNAALCLHKMGKSQEAHQYCEKAREIAPEDIISYMIEGRIYLEEGKSEEGIRIWGKALEYAPYASTWYEIGTYSIEIGELNYAKLAFERAREMDPDLEDINEKLTSLYMLLKDKENFMKYNQLSKRPLNLGELRQLQLMLEEDNQQDLALMIRSILDELQ